MMISYLKQVRIMFLIYAMLFAILSAGALANDRENLTQKVIAYWKFDDAGWKDKTSHALDLTAHGTMSTVSGVLNQSANLPDSASYWFSQSDAAFAVSHDFTFCAWANETAYRVYNMLASRDHADGTNDGWSLNWNSGGRFDFIGSSYLTCRINPATPVFVLNQWNFICLTMGAQAGNVTLWQNGVVVGYDESCSINVDTVDFDIGERGDGGFRPPQLVDEAFWVNRTWKAYEIMAVYNGGKPLPYENWSSTPPPPPVGAVSVLWGGYPPHDNMRNNTRNITFYFNTSGGCNYAELRNGTKFLANLSSHFEPNLKKNITAKDLTSGTYSMRVRCQNGTSFYNSTAKTITVDYTAPIIICPLCANLTKVANGTSYQFLFNLSDPNLDGYNFTIHNPDGTLFMANFSDGITGTAYSYKRTNTITQPGKYTGVIKTWDDHNSLASQAQKDQVAKYKVEKKGNSITIDTGTNKVNLKVLDADLEDMQAYLQDSSWHIDTAFKKNKNQVVYEFHSDNVKIRTKATQHVGHLILFPNFMDFDNSGELQSLQFLDDYTVRVTVKTDGSDKVKIHSFGELNINSLSFALNSSGRPLIVLNQLTPAPASPDADINISVKCLNDALGETLTAYYRVYNGTQLFPAVHSQALTNNTVKTVGFINHTLTAQFETWKVQAWCGDGYLNSTRLNSTVQIAYILMNFTFSDETTHALIQDRNVTLVLVHATFAKNYTSSIGYVEVKNVPNGTYTILYYASGYTQRTTTFVEKYKANVSLHALFLSNAEQVLIYVLDLDNSGLVYAEVQVLRYYVSCNCYQLIATSYTDVQGRTGVNLARNTVAYKFLINYGGKLVYESQPTYIYDSAMTIYVDLGNLAALHYLQQLNVNYDLTFSADQFRYMFSDPTHNVTQGCLKVWRVTSLDETLYNQSCIASSSGVTYIRVTPVNGTTYSAKVYVTIGGMEKYLDVLTKTYDAGPAIFAKLGLFFSFLITAVMILGVGYFSPRYAILMMPTGLLLSRIAGFLNLSYVIIVSMFALAFILVYLIEKRGVPSNG